MIRHGLKLDEIPWYVAAWYAYQSFGARDHQAWRENQATAVSMTSSEPTISAETQTA
jgi:hypothetical protein